MKRRIRYGSGRSRRVTLAAAYDFLNDRMFGGELPPVVLTVGADVDAAGCYIVTKALRQVRDTGNVIELRIVATEELVINPAIFEGRPDAQVLSTLVHEMCHHWQNHFGRVRGEYHNHQWAEKMMAVGLMPSVTGKPGGKKVGPRIRQYIIEGGPFDLAAKHLLSGGARLDWPCAVG